MTKNEKQMLLVLAKAVVRLSEITDKLIVHAPNDSKEKLKELAREVDAEIGHFVEKVQAEWGAPSE